MNTFDKLSDLEKWLWVMLVVSTKTKPGPSTMSLTVTMDHMEELVQRIRRYGQDCFEAGVEETKQKVADDLREGIANAIQAYLEGDDGL